MNLPCIDCVTLAVCRARANYLKETYGATVTNRSLISHLTNKCDLIYKYAYNKWPNKKHYLREGQCNKAVQYLISKDI